MEPELTNEPSTQQMIGGFPAEFPHALKLVEAGILDPTSVGIVSDADLRKIPGIGPVAIATIRAAARAAVNAEQESDAPVETEPPSVVEEVQVGSGPFPASLLTPILPILARNSATGKLAEHLVITVSADDFVQVATRRKEDGYTEVVAIGDTLEEALAEAAPQLKKLKGWA